MSPYKTISINFTEKQIFDFGVNVLICVKQAKAHCRISAGTKIEKQKIHR